MSLQLPRRSSNQAAAERRGGASDDRPESSSTRRDEPAAPAAPTDPSAALFSLDAASAIEDGPTMLKQLEWLTNEIMSFCHEGTGAFNVPQQRDLQLAAAREQQLAAAAAAAAQAPADTKPFPPRCVATLHRGMPLQASADCGFDVRPQTAGSAEGHMTDVRGVKLSQIVESAKASADRPPSAQVTSDPSPRPSLPPRPRPPLPCFPRLFTPSAHACADQDDPAGAAAAPPILSAERARRGAEGSRGV